MMSPRVGTPDRSRTALVFCALIAAAATGCSSSGSSSSAGPTLAPSDFVRAGGATAPAARRAPQPSITVEEAAQGPLDVVALPGGPVIGAGDGVPIEPAKFIDAKIGDINNRPIYASEILDEVGPLIRAETAKLPPAQRIPFARQAINERLRTLVEDELIRSEALAELKPQERQGLFYFMERIREEQLSLSGGSLERANERLEEEAGQDLDRWLEDRRNRELILYQLRRRVLTPVQVSWRDIQLAYEKSGEVFNPPPTAVFRLIRIDAKDEASAARVREALSAGTAFEIIAESEDNLYKRDEGGLYTRAFEGAFGAAEFFALPELNDAAHGLTPGQWAGPIAFGSSLAWLKLETIERRSMDLYTAQLFIEQSLREQRSDIARGRYLERLKGRASVSDIDDMTERLVALAAETYVARGDAE